MDKNIIKSYLVKAFLSEEATPGIKVTAAVKKESGKINKDGVKAIEKDVTAYDKALKQTDKENKSMGENKFNYTDDNEKVYHDEMEILNGQEMVEYNSEPSEEFTKRAKEGIEGSSRMGNEKGGNAEAAFGASSDDFGKDLVKRIKSSAKKRADAEIQTYGMGDVQIPTGRKIQTSKIAVNENNTEENSISEMGRTPNAIKNQLGYGYTHFAVFKLDGKIADGWDYKNLYDKFDKTYDNDSIKYYSKQDLSDNYPENKPSDFKIVTRNFLEKKGINITDTNNWFKHGMEDNTNNTLENNNNNNQIKESMKRLKFTKEFKGVGNALKLIPEAYRIDNKEFEMTDGNETYRIRWEGTLTEGRAVIITASDKKMINEDMQKMKHLMGYKSQDTLGLLKGNARVDENKSFSDIWNKTKVLLEGGDIESAKAKEGDLDKVKNHAPEAKKHVEGSVSKEKETTAPAPKDGSMESLDDAVNHAPEAKKHVEGSVSKEKETTAPAPKKGEWENVKKKATEATKHVTMKESFQSEEDEDETKTHEAGESAEFEAGEKEEQGEIKTESSNIEGGTTKKGNWDEIKVPHAKEAKKHIHLKENEDMEDDVDDDEEDSDMDAEPTAADITKDVPIDNDDDMPIKAPAPKGTSTILFSPSTGEYWLKVGDATTKVPDKFLEIASDKSIKAYQRAEKIVSLMQDEADNGIDMDIEDEETNA